MMPMTRRRIAVGNPSQSPRVMWKLVSIPASGCSDEPSADVLQTVRVAWLVLCLLLVAGCSGGPVARPPEDPGILSGVAVMERMPSGQFQVANTPNQAMWGRPGREAPYSESLITHGSETVFGFMTCTRGGRLTIDRHRAVQAFGSGFRVARPPELGAVNYAVMGVEPREYRPQRPALGAEVSAACESGDGQWVMVHLERTGSEGGGIAGLEITYHDETGESGVYVSPFLVGLCGKSTIECIPQGDGAS